MWLVHFDWLSLLFTHLENRMSHVQDATISHTMEITSFVNIQRSKV
jgi:hypothetical protein